VYKSELQAVALIKMLCNAGDHQALVEAGARTVIGALLILRKRYKGDVVTEFFTIQKEFDALSLQSKETINQYIDRAQELRKRMALSGHKIQERQLVAKLLDGLPKDYSLQVKIFKAIAAP
jgi:hypothetical protein